MERPLETPFHELSIRATQIPIGVVTPSPVAADLSYPHGLVVETPEFPPQAYTPESRIVGAAALTGEGVAQQGRLRRLLSSREVRGGVAPALRLSANLVISAVDAIPVLGNGLSWAADALKLLKPLDVLTPNVKKSVAWGSEALELVEFLGIPMPSHLVETSLQFWHDRHRLVTAFRAGSAILRNKDVLRQS